MQRNQKTISVRVKWFSSLPHTSSSSRSGSAAAAAAAATGVGGVKDQPVERGINRFGCHTPIIASDILIDSSVVKKPRFGHKAIKQQSSLTDVSFELVLESHTKERRLRFYEVLTSLKPTP